MARWNCFLLLFATSVNSSSCSFNVTKNDGGRIILRMATTLRVKILAAIRRTMTVKAPAVDVVIHLLS